MIARMNDLFGDNHRLGDPCRPVSAGGFTGRGGADFNIRHPSLRDWLATLRVSEGRNAGELLEVLDWQSAFLDAAFKPGISEALLSVARGNGKTTLFAAIAAASVAGPLMQPRGQTIVVASSFDQSKILFDHARHFLKPVIERHPHSWRVVDNFATALIENKLSGARLRCIGSDAKRAHGLAPSLLLADEPAKWTQGGQAMLTALETSLGKQPNSRMVALGTMPESDLHWFGRRIHAKAAGRHVALYRATDEDAWDNPEQWLLANPSLPHMPDLYRQIAKEAAEAKTNPSTLAAFRALRLNLGTPESEQHDQLVTPEQWRHCLSLEVPPPGENPVWGVDLGGTGAMSAIAAAWPSGRLDAIAMFGGKPSLRERGFLDGVGDLYQRCGDAGELLTSAGRIPNVAELFEAAYDRWGGMPAAIVADRWRIGELEQALDDAPRRWAKVPLVTRGQGYRDGSADVREFRRAVAVGDVRPVRPALLMTAALAEAVCVTDASGNAKLAKKGEGGRRNRARDDAAAAAILAVAHRAHAMPTAASVYRGAA